LEKSDVSRGNFFLLFTNWGRLKKYICCILIGAPLWFVVGILVSLQPEFGLALHATEKLNAGDGIQYAYIAIAIGGMVAGLLSQLLKSRKLVMLLFLLLSAVSVVVYLSSTGLSASRFLWLCSFMGFAVGYWTLFITIAAEQFGTNIRSTVATTVPNFVRGALIPISKAFLALNGVYGMIKSGYIMMAILTVLAILALSQLKETFNKDLNYAEVL